MDTLSIKTKISEKDFIKLKFEMSYKNNLIKIVSVVALLMMIKVGFDLIINGPNDYKLSYPIVFWIVFTLLLPLAVYRSAIRTYRTNNFIKNELCYDFSSSKFRVHGKDFNTEMNWDQIYKIEEVNDWILIYHDKIVANFIPKNDLTQIELKNLLVILKSISNEKVFLKN